ncbi:hypothetical protein WME75_30375 [Sorangium sp. So ce1014]|uniref:hypothetical protein n=1 Tax=Sorangium sp. So ce1014 TaxID=3133326 RepID=UPI003F608C0B
MAVTRSDLFDVIYRFYPSGMPRHDPGYDATEEHRRLVDSAKRGRAEYGTWETMLRRLGARYRLQDESLHILAGWVDPAYSAHIILPTHSLGFHVSFLGPYYAVHRTDDPHEEPVTSDIAQEIEDTYRGYQPIPPALGNEVVPDVDKIWKGTATIYLCLFSVVWGHHPFHTNSCRP